MNLSGYTMCILVLSRTWSWLLFEIRLVWRVIIWPTTALYYLIILMDYFCFVGPLQSFFWSMMHQLIFQIIMVCVILEEVSFKDSKNDLWFLRNKHLPLSTFLIQHSKWVQENHYIKLIWCPSSVAFHMLLSFKRGGCFIRQKRS